MHSPLSLPIIMLGTNDFQRMHDNRASGQPALIISTSSIGILKGIIAEKFEGACKKCFGLPDACREIADKTGGHFLDANAVTSGSNIDGVDLDEPGISYRERPLQQRPALF